MISPLFSLAFVLHSISDVAKEIDTTYSELDHSRPAGQSNAPVRSWWKPRSTFTLRARGGTRLCPFGVIQSRTLPLRLFVSSPLAPDAPLVSWSSMWDKQMTLKLKTSYLQALQRSQPRHLRLASNALPGLLQIWEVLEKHGARVVPLEYTQFNRLHITLQENEILGCEIFLRSVG